MLTLLRGLTMLSGATLMLGSGVMLLISILSALDEDNRGRLPGILFVGVLLILAFLFGRFLWNLEFSGPRQGKRRGSLEDFIRDLGVVTVAQVARFTGVSEQEAESLIQQLIARGEINLVFESEKGAYVVHPFIPEWTPAIPKPSVPLAPSVTAPASSSGVVVAIRSLHHRCPSCNAPQELGGAKPGDTVACPYCGSSFQVVATSSSPEQGRAS
ncbi:hypothetical protein [Myxococcus stipitatus]|uniref:hypothetical protein n=1 Tax=Myxococcus stipitatus TaxID=83455 RepID=UPI0030D1A08F